MLAAVITYVMTLSAPKRPTNCTALAQRPHTRASGLFFVLSVLRAVRRRARGATGPAGGGGGRGARRPPGGGGIYGDRTPVLLFFFSCVRFFVLPAGGRGSQRARGGGRADGRPAARAVTLAS